MAERVEETVRTEIAEHVEAIAQDNDSGPPSDRNDLRRYADALLINDEPKSDAAAELVGVEPETIRLLADAADDAASPLDIRRARALASGKQRTPSRVRSDVRRTAARVSSDTQN